MLRKFSKLLLVSSALVAAPALALEGEPASVAELVEKVDIPYQTFKLDNGLTVIVHEDRKAPLVAVSVWYRVGSKHEPKGKTGFAHLFEHLMFNGSENAPNDFFEPLKQVGATDFNGTTNVDRTNYFQTVPTGALDLALFLESDRMGHLLGAVTQEKLDNQRGVVQNEKRQGDNRPLGLLRYEIFENLFPKGHPYHHSTIGSMADLNSATLSDVKAWFTNNYGPNNAVLVLAGDVDLATAKAKVTEWFADIPSGTAVKELNGGVPTLDAPKSKTIKDLIPTTTLFRFWPIPGLNDPDAAQLQMGASVLGGLASSRLDNVLVRKEQIAVSVAAFSQSLEDAGFFGVQAEVKKGVDPALIAKRLDEEVAAFLASGPTEDELRRATTSFVSGSIGGLESVGGFGGKAVALAEGQLYSNNPGYYKVELDRLSKATPSSVKTALNKWLGKPSFSLTVEPGERTEGGENRGGAITASNPKNALEVLPDQYWSGDIASNDSDILSGGAVSDSFAADRSKFPAVASLQALDFPVIERARLKNGMQLVFARRAAVPTVNVSVVFDAGYGADPKNALGLQSLMLAMMDEGTTSLDSIKFAEAQERLGANVSASASLDETTVGLYALKPNLKPSLSLLADYIRNPAFSEKELERVRAQQLNRISTELNDPARLAAREIAPLLYGKEHPYGVPSSGLGNEPAVKAATRQQLIDYHGNWMRPDNAVILAVGDSSLKEMKKLLDKSLGRWKAPKSPKPTKNFNAALPKPEKRVILFNRPKSPQSVILVSHVLEAKGGDDLINLRAANSIFGGDFLSRINTNLRETKGWSYGVRSGISSNRDRISFTMSAPVQADRTADSILELEKDLKAFLSNGRVSDAELERTANGNVRELPGSFETATDVLGGIANIVKFGRPDDYYDTLAGKYRAMTKDSVDAAASKELKPDNLVYVIVGDAEVVKPQLEKLGLPIEIRGETATPAAKPASSRSDSE